MRIPIGVGTKIFLLELESDCFHCMGWNQNIPAGAGIRILPLELESEFLLGLEPKYSCWSWNQTISTACVGTKLLC